MVTAVAYATFPLLAENHVGHPLAVWVFYATKDYIPQQPLFFFVAGYSASLNEFSL